MSDEAAGSPSRRLVVIDGANSIYRAFFAIPNLRAPDGSPTNAVHGFVNMLGKVIREESPDLIAVAFDPRGGSFRNRLYGGYKANRDAQPEELSAQIPVIREVIDAFRIPFLEVDDFEADDVIATLVTLAPEDVCVSIISTDKDLMQLVSQRVNLVDSVSDRRFTPGDIEARFGVPPEQMLDLRSLVGDPSDNIPGVRGIGEKGAAKLLGQWGSLEVLLDHASEVSAKRAREALTEQREQALLSKALSTLRHDVPLPVDINELAIQPPDVDRLRDLYRRLGFSRLLASLDAAGDGAAALPRSERATAEVEMLSSSAELERWLQTLPDDSPLALYLLRGEGSAVDARAVGLGLAADAGRSVYVPLRGEGLLAEDGLTGAELVSSLRGLRLDDAGRQAQRCWYGMGAKDLQSVLAGCGLVLPTPAEDIEIAAYLLDPAAPREISALAATSLGWEVASWESVAGRGAKAVAAELLPVKSAAHWVGEQVCAVWALVPHLCERLEADGLMGLYRDVELPLTAVLSRLERAGVRIDEDRLAELSLEYEAELTRVEQEIYTLAGERFLVSSPKQLQVILFEKLKLPPLKKTKTGYSTAESVLEQLQAHHELPGRILEYRRLAKLKSTYIDALPPLVSGRSGRIHPHFNQLGAATGRLSAAHPNVQNIPIRTEAGARIREAFIPAEGRVLLSADYSQVELRILAHYSGDESLIGAFRDGEDIHRRTAAEVYGIPIDQVAEEQRARAKAVNFGIIYGSSAFGLANQLGIASAEAQETIDAYFGRYSGVRRFLDETVSQAKQRGYVITLLGRRRYLPDLQSRNRVLRQAAERMAVNTVIQGTAADLIKSAMVEVDRALRERELSAEMILQVHDELVFELDETDIVDLERLLRAYMENALSLAVPLVIDIGVGADWRKAH